MINIKDRVIGYDNSKALLHLDDSPFMTDAQQRLAEWREKFIKSIYSLLKSDDFKGFYVKQDEQLDVNIQIKRDCIEIGY